MDTDKVFRLKRDKVEKLSVFGSKTSGIPMKNQQVRGERRSWKSKRTVTNIKGRKRCVELQSG